MSFVIPLLSRLDPAEQQVWLGALRQALPEQTIAPLADLTAAQRADVAVAIAANPDPRDLATLPTLQWVQSLWAGVETLVVDTQGAAFAIVRMTDPQLAKTMAEAVLAWTLYLHRDMPRYRQQQAACIWHPQPLTLPQARTVGILGLGNLGTVAAQTLLQQGFTVCGWSRSPTQLPGITTFHGLADLPKILQRSQILVCLLPLTPATHGLLNQETLTLLPAGAALINFARGPIVDTAALISLLDAQHLSHAVLDVFDTEPLPPQSSLWSHPGMTILPHIAAPTHKQTASKIVAHNINRFIKTGQLPTCVDRRLGY